MNRAGARKSSIPRKVLSPTRFKGHILPVGTRPIRQELPRATFGSRHAQLSRAERHRRSDSGAAVRLTRGGELGFALGCALAAQRVARAEASRRGGPQLTLLLGPAGFDPLKQLHIGRLSCVPLAPAAQSQATDRVDPASFRVPSRPGLPHSQYRHTERNRRPRMLLVRCNQQHKWTTPPLLCSKRPSDQSKPTRLRFSIALPLGINKGRRTYGSNLG